MKNMKRFLSILLCAIMLTGMLPMNVSAKPEDEINTVTITVPETAGKTAEQVVDGITVVTDNAVTTVKGTPAINGAEVTVTLTMTPVAAGDKFHMGPKDFTLTVNGAKSHTSTKEDKKLTVTVVFELAHVCGNGTKQNGKEATSCKEAGYSEYYQCSCDKLYEDAACTTLIENLEIWKAGDGAITADHVYSELVAAQPEIHKKEELKGAVAAHYRCSVCEGYFKNDEEKTPTTLEKLTDPAPEHEYNTWVNTDPAEHWKKCFCGAENTEAKEPHVYNEEDLCECGHKKIHVCGNGTKQNGKEATCEEAGYSEYYQCSCGNFYVDAACTTLIENLEIWKAGDGATTADHVYSELVNAQSPIHAIAGGVNAHFRCTVCEGYFKNDADKTPTTLEELTGDIPPHEYNTWVNTDPAEHWKKCFCGAEDTEAKEPHVYNDEYLCECGRENTIRTVTFELTGCTIELEGDPKVTIQNSGESIQVEKGTVVRFKVKPAEGYKNDPSVEGATKKAQHYETSAITADSTVKVTAARATYNVAFKANGGNGTMDNQVFTHGEAQNLRKNTFTRDGHTFAGWATDKNGPVVYTDEQSVTVTKNTDLHAKWTKDETPEDSNKHEVKFEVYGGSAVTEQQVENGQCATKPEDPTYEGHIFAGWYTDKDYKNEYDFSAQVTKDITLHAKWTRDSSKHKVTFDWKEIKNNKGENSKPDPMVEAMYVADGEKITQPAFDNSKVKETHDSILLYWYYEEGEGKNKVEKEFKFDSTTITGDITLHAKCAKIHYVFVYENAEQLAAKNPFDQAMFIEGDTLEAADFEKADPNNLYDKDDSTKKFELPATMTGGCVHLIGVPVPSYTVTFDANGHGTAPAAKTVKAGAKVGDPGAITGVDHYTFGGWYTESNCDNAYDFETTPVNGNITLYAKWTPVVVSVTVTPENVDLYPGEKQQFAAAVEVTGNLSKDVIWTITPASGISLLSEEDPAAIDENGLVTLGANATGSYIVTATSVADETKSDTAIVNVLPYNTVEFHMHLHGDQVPAQNLKAGEKVTKPTDPTATGYTFGGWYTDDTFTTEYDFNTEVKNSFTLHAKWTEVEAPAVTYFKVTYDANGGKGEMPVVTVESGKVHTILENEFKAPSGKVFKCWKIDGVEFKAGEKIEVTEDVTIKAVWKTKSSADLDYVPATGDNFPTFLWAGLLLFSVVALVEVAALRRKRR